METERMHIEMDCYHNHSENTMTCSWLGGRVKIVVYFATAQLGILRDEKVVVKRDIAGMSCDDLMRLQELCQRAAIALARFDREVAELNH